MPFSLTGISRTVEDADIEQLISQGRGPIRSTPQIKFELRSEIKLGQQLTFTDRSTMAYPGFPTPKSDALPDPEHILCLSKMSPASPSAPSASTIYFFHVLQHHFTCQDYAEDMPWVVALFDAQANILVWSLLVDIGACR